MVRVRVSVLLIALITLEHVAAEQLWCYECNTDLREGHKGECNDPYTPGPSVDLHACPRDEPYHCLKSVIFYRNILVTVRACVPSWKVEGYCHHEDYFPESHIECYFCNTYGCNNQGKPEVFSVGMLSILVISMILLSNQLT